MNIAGTLLIAIAIATPRAHQATASQSTSISVDHRHWQLYSPSAAPAARPLYLRRDTWYEFVLKQFNPDDIDYGSWLEKRRQAFLEASIQNPYFKYSAGATLALVLMILLVAK